MPVPDRLRLVVMSLTGSRVSTVQLIWHQLGTAGTLYNCKFSIHHKLLQESLDTSIPASCLSSAQYHASGRALLHKCMYM